MTDTGCKHSRSGRSKAWAWLTLGLLLGGAAGLLAADASVPSAAAFPPPLESYQDAHLTQIWEVLRNRVQKVPFNLWATLLFLGAVTHTFFTHRFQHWAHAVEQRHKARQEQAGTRSRQVNVAARILHFFGEVEVVFGIWAIPVFLLMILKVGPESASHYLNHRLSFNEPLFVVVIMTIAATRPILRLAEGCLRQAANLGGGSPGTWWLATLTVGPLLGSLITEPGAMTISALILARQFYEFKPRPALAYATLGLLFVNVSVGGTLTHFAAPPVLMVSGPWHWSTPFMIRHFGMAAVTGILVSNLLFLVYFRKDIAALSAAAQAANHQRKPEDAIPVWVTLGHLGFMVWAVMSAHYPRMLVFCLLFFIAFYEVTEDFQSTLSLRPAVLVGFFLAGLVFHGGLQQWWIAPVLSRLGEIPLFLGATFLTAFNDNAAITYLSTMVPHLTDGMKHAVVAGAVTGGGLTVIANAPNPAGQAILKQFFPQGISPLGLLLGALIPTILVALSFNLVK